MTNGPERFQHRATEGASEMLKNIGAQNDPQLECAVEAMFTADGIIGAAGSLAGEAAAELRKLVATSDESKLAAAFEAATEHYLGSKKVNSAVAPGGMTQEEWETYRRIAALRQLGSLRRELDALGRALVWRLHKDEGVTAMRLAEAFGVSNTTTSNWIREAKARNDE